jgi:hypothetical protein
MYLLVTAPRASSLIYDVEKSCLTVFDATPLIGYLQHGHPILSGIEATHQVDLNPCGKDTPAIHAWSGTH